MLVKMYKLEYKIETNLFIQFNKTGEMNNHTNVFILAYIHFCIFFSSCSHSVKIALEDENAIKHNIKLVYGIFPIFE